MTNNLDRNQGRGVAGSGLGGGLLLDPAGLLSPAGGLLSTSHADTNHANSGTGTIQWQTNQPTLMSSGIYRVSLAPRRGA